MTEIYILEPVSTDAPSSRLPDGLPISSPDRGPLELALRKAGLAVVPVNAVITPSPEPEDDRRSLRASVAAVVNSATDAERERLESAITASPDDGLDEKFWGQAPDSVTASQAVFSGLQDQFTQRRQLVAQSISREDAAQLLGVAPQSITAKLTSGKLVGLKVGREWRLPLWQFNADNPSGVLPDLDLLQTVFPGGVVSLSRWMQRKQPEFDGRTPRTEMALHGSEPVITLAQALTAAAW